MIDRPIPKLQIIAKIQYYIDEGALDDAIKFTIENQESLAGDDNFYVEFGSILMQLGYPARASEFFLEAYKINPDSDDITQQLVGSFDAAEQPQLATKILWNVWERHPFEIEILSQLETRYAADGDFDTAREMSSLAAVVKGENINSRPPRIPACDPTKIRSIAIVAPFPRPRNWKIARAIQSFGAEVIFIHHKRFQPQAEGPYTASYSYGSLLELRDAIRQVQAEHKPELFHVFCDGYGYLDAVILMNMVSEPVIWDYYDMVNVSYTLESTPEYDLSSVLELWCMKHADGVCARNLEIQVAKRRDYYQRNGNIIFYPDYCHGNVNRRQKFGDHDGRLHVFISDPIRDPGLDKSHPNSLRPIIEHLVQLDIIQLYISPHHNQGTKWAKIYPGYVKLEEEYDNLTIQQPKSEGEYLEIISQVDVMIGGICRVNPGNMNENKITSDHIRNYFPGKFSDFLDSDVMFILPKYEPLEFCSWLVKRLDVGLVPTPEEIYGQQFWRQLHKKIRSEPINYSEARNFWSIERQAGRLHDFYRNIVQHS
ncbi:MAG: hypothetical protein HN884_10065 [Rhodospirillaceae bacterium]|jgi:tetratricopeptide (TPR) repeat protein|nr:hypothetical protein [Rhodospirillaceae bacterium]